MSDTLIAARQPGRRRGAGRSGRRRTPRLSGVTPASHGWLLSRGRCHSMAVRQNQCSAPINAVVRAVAELCLLAAVPRRWIGTEWLVTEVRWNDEAVSGQLVELYECRCIVATAQHFAHRVQVVCEMTIESVEALHVLSSQHFQSHPTLLE